jgi:hypothetical protein
MLKRLVLPPAQSADRSPSLIIELNAPSNHWSQVSLSARMSSIDNSTMNARLLLRQGLQSMQPVSRSP